MVNLFGKKRKTLEALNRLFTSLFLFINKVRFGFLPILRFRSLILRGKEAIRFDKVLLNLFRTSKFNVGFDYISYDFKQSHGFIRLKKARRI
jgi:hypothetical protein